MFWSLFVNGRNFAVFFQPIKCRPDISRTLWFPAFCPFWISYPSISYSFICLKASSANHRSNFYEMLASLQGGHCYKLSSSIKLRFLCLLAIFLEQFFVSTIAGNPNDKKKASVILFSYLIAEFVLTLSRNPFYIGLFIFVVCLVTMVAWGVAYDISVSTNLAPRIFHLWKPFTSHSCD